MPALMAAECSPITLTGLAAAQKYTIVERLDRSFFRSHLKQLTEPEKKFLRAITGIGPGLFASLPHGKDEHLQFRERESALKCTRSPTRWRNFSFDFLF